MASKLLFVYNANSGKLNSLFGIAHKIISPSTYTCELCLLTHGVFFENIDWKNFKETSSLVMEFFHVNEFLKIYSDEEYSRINFPAVLSCEQDGGVKEIFSSMRIQSFKTPTALIDELKLLEYCWGV